MTLAYVPPQVTVSEETSPSVSPRLALAADLCFVGLTLGYQTRTDQFKLNGTSAIPLPGLPSDSRLQSVVSVKDALDPTQGAADGTGYVVTTDYTVNTTNGTITRVGGGDIANGALVNVTYRYVPDNYYDPIRLFDQQSVESRFGPAVLVDGTGIATTVSYATAIAFENGAPSVVIQPLFVRSTPGDPSTDRSQPNATQAAAAGTWADTLYVLRDIEDVNLIIPVVGQSAANVDDPAQLTILQTVQDHIYFMRTQQQYIIGLFAEDSSTSNSVAQKATLRSHAITLQGRYGGAVNQQIAFVNTSKHRRNLPLFSAATDVGGQYMAAALGGMVAARPVSSSLTRKVVAGFVSVSDPRSRQDKDLDAANGLLVVENYNGVVQVRHGITMDNTNSATRELSVVRGKHRMIESIRDTLETQVIGNLIADANAPGIVGAAISGVLANLVQIKDITSYSDIQVRFVSLDPTRIQVKFSYRPSFVVNYIDVIFSIDMSSQTVELVPNSTLAGT